MCVGCGDSDASGPGPGGGGPGGGGNVSSGLPASQVASDLSQEDVSTLCDTFGAAASNRFSDGAMQEFTCTLAAVPASLMETENGEYTVDVASCQQIVQQCMQEEPPMGEMETFDLDTAECEADLGGELMGCTATVGELEACMNGIFSALDQILTSVTCESASPDSLEMLGEDLDFVDNEACQVVQTKCPELELFEDEAMSSGGGGGGSEPSPTGCDDTCPFSGDGDCDDGGADSDFDICGYGTDCTDCGPRDV